MAIVPAHKPGWQHHITPALGLKVHDRKSYKSATLRRPTTHNIPIRALLPITYLCALF